jgi:Ca2+-binding RTX toxin-like protein
MRRTAPLAVALAFVAIVPPTGAHAVEPECALDVGTAIATVTPIGGSATIHHDGATIYVDGIACAALDDVDRIDVVGAIGGQDELAIDFGNGPFAPGKTDEEDGSSEIEFGLDGHLHLTLQGGDGSERITAGVSGDALFNLDSTESVGDADLQIPTSGLLSLTVTLGAGADTFDGSGGHGTGDFFFSLEGVPVIVQTGGGGDQVYPSVSDAGIFDGGPGTDAFSVRSFSCGSRLDLVEGTGFLCTTGPAFELIALEHITATKGDDFVVTTARDEIIWGLSGDDIIIGSRGADTFEGGPGYDGVSYGQLDRGIAGDLRSGSVIGAGDDSLSSIEILGGTAHADILLGNARDNRLYGSGGRDELLGRGGADLHDGGDGRDDCHQRDATAGDTFTACER